MALYREGKAAMAADGTVIGTGTKWQSSLSLIRPGATIMFLSSPIQMAVVNKVVSDTEIKAITTKGAVVASSDYAILLSDSLTVDGLAQDVAETLRYYQSQETVIADAVEFFKTFDFESLQNLANQVKADSQSAGTSAAAAAASESAAKTSETNAKASENKAKTSETNAKASETAAKTSETNAKSSENKAKTSETNAKASETAAKTSETNAKSSETAVKTSETNAKASETAAKTSETNAKSSENKAKTSETNAKASETAAKTARDQVQQIINDAGEQSTLVVLSQPNGAGKIGLAQGGVVQDVLTEIPASMFGVTGDGVACGAACVEAIEYIMINGGTLVFPEGEVNWGTTRHKFAIYNGKPCTIKGSDGGTTWTFDNVDPVANGSGAIWPFSEPFLVTFGGQPTTQGVFVEPVTVENLTIDYTRQANKGGPTYETMGVGAHPTPYSDGTLGLRFSYCRSPVVRNVTMREIYGSGIQFWKCSMALAENNYLYNVSANQPLGSGGNESVDHFGWAIWSGASPKTIIRRNTAINKRVFVCDPELKSPINNVVYNGTLCGYIGMFAEYGSNGGTSTIYPPDFEWQADESADKRTYIALEDNLVWGYTMSIKSEATTSARIINNTLLNHYIGVSVQASADVVGNYINGLQADLQKCPQNGFELQRGGIQLSWWASSVQDHRQYVAQNYVYSAAYNCISIGKAYATIDDNQFTITRAARFINSVTSFNVDLLEMRGNKFMMSESCTQTVPIRVTNCSKVVLESNLIENKSTTTHMSVQMANPVIRNNTFKGRVQLYLASDGSIVEENISTDDTSNKGLAIQVASASDCIIRRNRITKYNVDDADQIFFLSNAARTVIEDNIINYDAATGAGRTKSIPVIKTYGTCFYTRILNNRVTGDSSATFGFTLFDGSSGARVLECRGNSTDNATRQMFTMYAQSGPWFVSGNDWTQTYSSEVNTASNIYASYKPAIGEKVPYLRPQAGGAEGIVYTASGWLTFGSIAAS